MGSTATEKLQEVREFADGCFPVYRAAILRTHEEQMRDQGFDNAMKYVQEKLRSILDRP